MITRLASFVVGPVFVIVFAVALVLGTGHAADAAKPHHNHKPRLSQVKPGQGGSCARVAVGTRGACSLGLGIVLN